MGITSKYNPLNVISDEQADLLNEIFTPITRSVVESNNGNPGILKLGGALALDAAMSAAPILAFKAIRAINKARKVNKATKAAKVRNSGGFLNQAISKIPEPVKENIIDYGLGTSILRGPMALGVTGHKEISEEEIKDLINKLGDEEENEDLSDEELKSLAIEKLRQKAAKK